MRAKLICQTVEASEHNKTAKLTAVCDGNKENQEFNEYTPFAELKIMIDKKGAMNFFEPGKEYYLDFTDAID